MRVSELSCRLWVFPFAHEALAVAGGVGGRIKKVGFCRENVIFELPYPATRFGESSRCQCHANAMPVWEGSTTVIYTVNCRLAKFRDLMRRVKYGAVIGHKMHFFVCAQFELPGYLYGFLFSQSQRRI